MHKLEDGNTLTNTCNDNVDKDSQIKAVYEHPEVAGDMLEMTKDGIMEAAISLNRQLHMIQTRLQKSPSYRYADFQLVKP